MDEIEGADGLVIYAEWREFRNPNFKRIGTALKTKRIFDGRHVYNPQTVADAGFK